MKFEIKIKKLGGAGFDKLVFEDHNNQLTVTYIETKTGAEMKLGLAEKEDVKRLGKAI